MSRIKILPSEISVKIAAGEVIERPSSVVKELVENSLDAGAMEIRVELLDGGKGLIKVIDNGSGMNRDDALLCFERHSTSKIENEHDLERITTMGFRGEALPSISSVSKLTLKTNIEGSQNGTQIQREGNLVTDVSDIAFPRGTTIEVRDLFFNLPARKKFLRSAQAELTRIAQYLTLAALAHPQIRFSLFNGQRDLFNTPAVEGLKERIFQIYGKDTINTLMEVDYKDGERQLYGFVSIPPAGRRNRKRQHFFVNNRPVKDKTIQAAFNQAFRNFLEKDHFAEGYLFLSIPFNEVDVNVHPAKSEVRFEDTRPLYQFVFRCIEQAVLKEKGVKEFYKTSEETPRYWIKEKHHQPGFDYNEEKGEKEIFFEKETVFFEEDGRKETSKTILGQYLNAYIVASDEDGIVIIDQHNAHERIIYDGFQKIEQNEKWPRKLSLLSILMEFSAAQELSYENEKDFLQDIGFHIEHMGGKSYALKEFPALYKDDEAKEVFLALLEDAGDKKVEKKHHEILSTMACKAAIKYGEKLGREKMVFLVEELFNSSNPGVCPHGRPIVIKLTKNDIEKGLKRR